MRILVLLLCLLPSFSFAAFFPQSGQVLTYQMAHYDTEGTEEVSGGEFVIQALDSQMTPDGLKTKYLSYSTTFPTPQYFSITEGKRIIVEGITYIGPGSDEVPGSCFSLVALPMTMGEKQDEPLMLSTIMPQDTLTIGGSVYQATRVSLIGTWGHYYTMAGDYWLVEGLGIVKASYITVDGRNVEYELLHRQ